MKFNQHMKNLLIPGEILVTDECISPYEGIEAIYSTEGMPGKVKIQRKPRGLGIEMKSTADGRTRMICYLEIQEGKDAMKADKKGVANYLSNH